VALLLVAGGVRARACGLVAVAKAASLPRVAVSGCVFPASELSMASGAGELLADRSSLPSAVILSLRTSTVVFVPRRLLELHFL